MVAAKVWSIRMWHAGHAENDSAMPTDYIEYIDDTGVVESVDARTRTVTVAVEGGEDCAACPAARLCRVASSADRRVTVPVTSPSLFKPGQRVTLRGSERMHRKAIMLATVLPCIALVAVMVLVWLLTANELAAALCGVAVTAAFFFLLYLMRNRIAHEFTFELIPISD